ncbi:hypothetical protein GCM10020000_04930 [Streptomyces olivoverticillatus]
MVDDRHHVVAAHLPGCADLLLEAEAVLLVVRELTADHFERHWLLTTGSGKEHRPHASLANPGQ